MFKTLLFILGTFAAGMVLVGMGLGLDLASNCFFFPAQDLNLATAEEIERTYGLEHTYEGTPPLAVALYGCGSVAFAFAGIATIVGVGRLLIRRIRR